ncbi:MAG: hypothetical protein WCS69_10525 [Ignavibacteriaceae bacterium]|jgi:hypothetical protein
MSVFSKNYQNMFTGFFTVLVSIIILMVIGCKNEDRPVHSNEHSLADSMNAKELNIESYVYIKNIFQRDGNYFASIIFLEHRLKNQQDVMHQKKSPLKFPDSLEVLELPDAYFISIKGKTNKEYLVNKNVHIKMQTLNYDSTGSFKFNEDVDLNKFVVLFPSKEYQRYKTIPFKINISKNEIDSIIEHYIP